MKLHYLEIVADDIDALCATYTSSLGITFSAPMPELGGARTAEIQGGGLLGIRAPMHESETPTVRPYASVENLEAALQAAESSGGTTALGPTEIPGRGRIAIYLMGGAQHGIWQA